MDDLNLNQDWMKALKDAGCPYMSYIKKAGLEAIHYTEGDCYDAIVVYLEKEYSPDCILLSKHPVDVALIKAFNHPVKGLCDELKTIVEAMDRKAAQDAAADSKA